MRPFDPLTCPLSGRRLIEASAGTGKTYNIANLYLRLVIGSGIDFENPLSVDQILVVTFTRAAAGELRARIRALLERAYREFRAGGSEDVFIRDLITAADAKMGHIVERLRNAILCMDEARISTIHSFAVNAASAFLFETGAIAGKEVSEFGKERDLRKITDLYRHLAASSDDSVTQFLARLGVNSFAEFAAYWSVHLPMDVQSLPALPNGTGGRAAILEVFDEYEGLAQRHQQIGREWRGIFPLLPENELKDRIQHNITSQISVEFRKNNRGVPVDKNLVTHIEKSLCSPIASYEDKTNRGYFQKWLRLNSQTGQGEGYDLFLRVREHFQEILQFTAQVVTVGRSAILQAIVEARARIDLNQLSLDDVIRLINHRLDDESASADLRGIITETYPVCLVDEFQDTDPEQFRMFNRIYERATGDSNIGFFMIGDPKQSIYAFRGADVFAYLNVRGEEVRNQQINLGEPQVFSLGTNWRSKRVLVDATNELFKEFAQLDETGDEAPRKLTFVFEGMEYRAVNSCEIDSKHTKPEYTLGDHSQLTAHPLVFVGNSDNPDAEDAKFDKSTLHRKFARDTARRISALLDSGSGARLTRPGNSKNKPIRPGDIAVLVRSGREARAVREALAQPDVGLRCVYLSQKDSVFSDSEISEDLYHVLIAINEHSDKRRLKAALATPLMRGFGFDFREIDQVECDDAVLEGLIEEFGGYRSNWTEHGILTALNRLWGNSERKVLQQIAVRHDSDRVLTDLRHLGDLLQQQDLQCDSREQLIDWYAKQLSDDSALDEDSKRIRLESDEDLIKIVTVHVAKGLEYPVVFLPFFYLPWSVDLKKTLPTYHRKRNGGYEAVVDFQGDPGEVIAAMERESLAEDMRLLYVAVTRAIYQCYVGISASTSNRRPMFGKTVWAHLLEPGGESNGEWAGLPGWDQIRTALAKRLENVQEHICFSTTGEVKPCKFVSAQTQQIRVEEPRAIAKPGSSWQITSYSSLAKGKKVSLDDKEDDEDPVEIQLVDDDALIAQTASPAQWENDIRYVLKGSKQTGSCLHDILEQHARLPNGNLAELVSVQLARYGLDKPGRELAASDAAPAKACDEHQQEVARWLRQALDQPLGTVDRLAVPSLQTVFASRQAVAEMGFDFAIGLEHKAEFQAVNSALRAAQLAPLDRWGKIDGLMNGAIDLVFLHDRKVFIADYKSNTLGKSPGFYDERHMADCMASSRYDLQYMIYTVAAHRYFKLRLGNRYDYDDGEYTFGGVYYLFLRGMGLDDPYRRHGIWFTRPDWRHVQGLDQAFLAPAPGED